jgi:homoserine acetyltransferase
LPEENRKTAIYLDSLGIENYLFEINSKDGHDAFLIENRKIGEILEPYLKGVEKELVI